MTFNELKIDQRFRILYPDPNDPQVYRKTGMFEFYSYQVNNRFRLKADKAKLLQVELVEDQSK